MSAVGDLETIRHALGRAIALVDQLSDRRDQPIDKAIISLLDGQPHGLSGASIRSLLKRRRIDVVVLTLSRLLQNLRKTRSKLEYG
jgi:hypothetical protein